jgi:hypothetical protein
MATRIKLREKAEPATDETNVEVHSQRRPPNHRYLLQVDRQTKTSYPTMEAATTIRSSRSASTTLWSRRTRGCKRPTLPEAGRLANVVAHSLA